MPNYKKFNVMEQKRKRQAQFKQILEEFLKETDAKKLIAELFDKAFNAGMFGKFPATARLNLDFQFGNFEFRLMRQPRGASLRAQQNHQNELIRAILAQGQQRNPLTMANHMDQYINYNKKRKKELEAQRRVEYHQ